MLRSMSGEQGLSWLDLEKLEEKLTNSRLSVVRISLTLNSDSGYSRELF